MQQPLRKLVRNDVAETGGATAFHVLENAAHGFDKVWWLVPLHNAMLHCCPTKLTIQVDRQFGRASLLVGACGVSKPEVEIEGKCTGSCFDGMKDDV